MAKAENVQPVNTLAIPSAPRTRVMPQKESDQKFNDRFKKSVARFAELRALGLTVTRSGNSVLLSNEDVKVSMPSSAMYDDTAYNSYRLGFGKKLYDAEDRKIGREAVWAAIAYSLRTEAEATLAKATTTE